MNIAGSPAQQAAVRIEAVPVEIDVLMDPEYQRQVEFLKAQARMSPTLHYLLKQIVHALPQNKDWLDPALEDLAKRSLGHLDELDPRIALLKVQAA